MKAAASPLLENQGCCRGLRRTLPLADKLTPIEKSDVRSGDGTRSPGAGRNFCTSWPTRLLLHPNFPSQCPKNKPLGEIDGGAEVARGLNCPKAWQHTVHTVARACLGAYYTRLKLESSI